MPYVEIGRTIIKVRVERREQIWRESAAEGTEVITEERPHVVERFREPVARRELPSVCSPGVVGHVGDERVVIGLAMIGRQEKDRSERRIEPRRRTHGRRRWRQEGRRRTRTVDVGKQEKIAPGRARVL